MKALKINLSDYGSNLGSRLLGRDIINSLKNELLISDCIIVDFSNVNTITLSFGTEFFDSIFSYTENVETLNKNERIQILVSFCLQNIKKKEFSI